MDHELRVRPARPGDYGEAETLLARCDLPADGVAEEFSDAYCIARLNDDIVGIAGVEKHSTLGLLRSVAVAPGSQGIGIGRALVRDRLEWAREQGLEAVYLLTTDAVSYFERAGFQVVERADVPAAIRATSEFVSICPADAAVMRMPLAGHRAMPAGDPQEVP